MQNLKLLRSLRGQEGQLHRGLSISLKYKSFVSSAFSNSLFFCRRLQRSNLAERRARFGFISIPSRSMLSWDTHGVAR